MRQRGGHVADGRAGRVRHHIGAHAVQQLRAQQLQRAAVEAIPFDGPYITLHIELLVKRGVTLLAHLVLTALARDGVTECLLVVAPLLVTGGTGSPINPIAIT